MHFCKFKYLPGGKFDTGTGFGLRYRKCSCGRKDIFDDFIGDYVQINGSTTADIWLGFSRKILKQITKATSCIHKSLCAIKFFERVL
jgi:hypothetical protein